MKSIDFEDSNVNFAENQDEYVTLPALRLDTPEDHVITKIGLSWKERFQLLFQGHFWMVELNFKRSLTPRYFTTDRKAAYSKESD